jgi:hypothetical protein
MMFLLTLMTLLVLSTSRRTGRRAMSKNKDGKLIIKAKAKISDAENPAEEKANNEESDTKKTGTYKGKSNTLNFMMQFCNFNYVAILDVDDIWHPQKLEVQSHFFINNYDVIGSNCIWFGDREGVIPPIPIGDISNFDFKTVNPIINSSSIIKKELCYWNANCDGVEDYDLWLKLRRARKQFYNCKEILVKHRIHQKSAFNANGKNNSQREELLNSY